MTTTNFEIIINNEKQQQMNLDYFRYLLERRLDRRVKHHPEVEINIEDVKINTKTLAKRLSGDETSKTFTTIILNENLQGIGVLTLKTEGGVIENVSAVFIAEDLKSYRKIG